MQDIKELTLEDAVKKRAHIEELDSCIRHWLCYCMRKLQKMCLKMQKSQMSDLWNIYSTQLAGITKPPKAHQDYQKWMTDDNNTKILALAVDERWQEKVLSRATGKPNGKIRMVVVQELFQVLPEDEREEWLVKAKETAAYNKKEYSNLLKALMNLETPAGRKHKTCNSKCNQTQNMKAGSSKSSLAPPCSDYSFLVV
ncbi:hypothetical protein ARMGADRAFT_1031990 [Armillaria gallica]|uniref:Uncharacterized protein n=1 Tax=Armillaria gallica TaxID=47427 RepID=A0A2H3DHF0_ARMGA|nr:hypothetical protein ARMGADRAFT_1031990 [Armillaria gallica]